MAAFEKRSDRWRVKVRRKGINKSESFRTKAEAKKWAIQMEADIDAGRLVQATSEHTLADALIRYRNEIADTKVGARWERLRLDRFLNGLPKVNTPLNEITPDYIGQWRDKRLQEVKPATVNRELNQLSSVFTTAMREWRWCRENPVRMAARPKNPRGRDRLISDDEKDTLLEAFGYVEGKPPERAGNYVAYAFLVALETAMRKGEILSLNRGNVFEKRVNVLGKNGDYRDVPLSTRARELLAVLLEAEKGDAPLFKVSGESVSVLFRKACKRKGIEDLRFHDTRHDAITRLARKLEVLELARMVGHRDLRSLMIYYNETADSIADRLG